MKKSLLFALLFYPCFGIAQDSTVQVRKVIAERIDSVYREQNAVYHFQKNGIDFLNRQLLSPSQYYKIGIDQNRKISWKTAGIMYVRGQGANLGVSSFCIID